MQKELKDIKISFFLSCFGSSCQANSRKLTALKNWESKYVQKKKKGGGENSHVFSTLPAKKKDNFGGNSHSKSRVKILGIPSLLEGVP